MLKWFYGQSHWAYYYNYFIQRSKLFPRLLSISVQCWSRVTWSLPPDPWTTDQDGDPRSGMLWRHGKNCRGCQHVESCYGGSENFKALPKRPTRKRCCFVSVVRKGYSIPHHVMLHAVTKQRGFTLHLALFIIMVHWVIWCYALQRDESNRQLTSVTHCTNWFYFTLVKDKEIIISLHKPSISEYLWSRSCEVFIKNKANLNLEFRNKRVFLQKSLIQSGV